MNASRIFKFLAPLCIIAAGLLLSPYTGAQSWDRYEIDDSGCSASFPFQPDWVMELSDDSSLVWTGEVYEGENYYGMICVEFKEYFMDATDEELILLAEGYLDFLQTQFDIETHTGYITDYTHETNQYAVGVSDSWTDTEGDPWEVKAWIDHFNIAVMYSYGSKEYFDTGKIDFFFESFQFPEY